MLRKIMLQIIGELDKLFVYEILLNNMIVKKI